VSSVEIEILKKRGKHMKVTFILKDLSEEYFYNLLNALETGNGKYEFILVSMETFPHFISQKIGRGQFKERVELNQLMRKTDVKIDFKISDRRGYKLAAFEIN
jgi:hypothetical protein